MLAVATVHVSTHFTNAFAVKTHVLCSINPAEFIPNCAPQA